MTLLAILHGRTRKIKQPSISMPFIIFLLASVHVNVNVNVYWCNPKNVPKKLNFFPFCSSVNCLCKWMECENGLFARCPHLFLTCNWQKTNIKTLYGIFLWEQFINCSLLYRGGLWQYVYFRMHQHISSALFIFVQKQMHRIMNGYIFHYFPLYSFNCTKFYCFALFCKIIVANIGSDLTNPGFC